MLNFIPKQAAGISLVGIRFIGLLKDDITKMAGEDEVVFCEPDEYLPDVYLCGVKDPNGNCVEFSIGHSVPPVQSIVKALVIENLLSTNPGSQESRPFSTHRVSVRGQLGS